MSTFRITHHTSYRHSAPVAVAWQTVRLQPRREAGQELLAFELAPTPRPAEILAREDYFGNVVHAFSVAESHAELSIETRAVVRRTDAATPSDNTPAVSAIPPLVAAAIAGGNFTLEEYRRPGTLVPFLPEARALADGIQTSTALGWIAALGQRFREQFTFDTSASVVTTLLREVLVQRRGVCQDFAHAFISCARQHGVPAAYVSGYLLTDPPPGQPRLRGADAMHAWVSLFVPGAGWVDYDPTNTVFAGTGHIAVARGRDYADVSPIRGVFSGGGRHTLFLGITVEPADELGAG